MPAVVTASGVDRWRASRPRLAGRLGTTSSSHGRPEMSSGAVLPSRGLGSSVCGGSSRRRDQHGGMRTMAIRVRRRSLRGRASLTVFRRGRVEAIRDFDRSTREQAVQAVDREQRAVCWTVDCRRRSRGPGLHGARQAAGASACPTRRDECIVPAGRVRLTLRRTCDDRAVEAAGRRSGRRGRPPPFAGQRHDVGVTQMALPVIRRNGDGADFASAALTQPRGSAERTRGGAAARRAPPRLGVVSRGVASHQHMRPPPSARLSGLAVVSVTALQLR